MSLTQGLGLPFGIQVVNPVAVDSWSGPYQSIAEANSSVPSGVRYIGVISGVTVGRTVIILNNGIPTDYWWFNGTADNNLVVKNYSSTGSTGSTYFAGQYLTLSGNTFIVTGLTPSINYIGVSGISVNGNQISYTGSTGINYIGGNAISVSGNVISYTGGTGNTYFAGQYVNIDTSNNINVTGLTPTISLSANTFYVSLGGSNYRSSNLLEDPNDPNIALNVNSTTKGVLLPALIPSVRDALTGVTSGLLAYDSNIKTFNFYDNTRWRNVSYLYPDSVSTQPSNGTSLKTPIENKLTGQITLTNGSGTITGIGTALNTQLLNTFSRIFVYDGLNWYVISYGNANLLSPTSMTFSNNATLATYYSTGFNATSTLPINTIFLGNTGTYDFYLAKSFSTGFASVVLGYANFVNSNYSLVAGLNNVVGGVGNGSFAIGNLNYISGYGFALGDQNIITGFGGMAMGTNAQANGTRSFAGGNGRRSGTIPSAYQNIIASGSTAFIFSNNSASQTAGHGALANQSVILGGQDHNIPADSPRSVILGGNLIKARSATPDLVYVPSLNLVNNPVNSVGNTFKLLGRSSFSGNTGDAITVLLDPNTLAITSNGLTYIGSSGNTYFGGDGISISANTISYTGVTSSIGYFITDHFIYLSGNPQFITTNNIGILFSVEQRGVDLIESSQFTVLQNPSAIQILTGTTNVVTNDNITIKYFTGTGATLQATIINNIITGATYFPGSGIAISPVNVVSYTGYTSSSPNYQKLFSNYTTLPSDQYLECSGTTSLVLLTSGITAGKSYEIFNNGSSSVTTITTSTGALINGLSNKVLNIPNQTAKAVWNGTEIKLYY